MWAARNPGAEKDFHGTLVCKCTEGGGEGQEEEEEEEGLYLQEEEEELAATSTTSPRRIAVAAAISRPSRHLALSLRAISSWQPSVEAQHPFIENIS
jgi:hypothetical protein